MSDYIGKVSYYYYKSIGICPYCKKNKSYKNLVACLECRIRINSFKRSKIAKEKDNIRSKEKRYKLRKACICYYCGKRKVSKGKKSCYICRKKRTIKRNNKKIKNELENVCNFCGKRQRLENKKVCKECYDTLLERIDNMNKIRGKNNWIDHPWKKVTFNV